MSRINTNIQSLIATRILGNNQKDFNRALTRLSTGLRINTGKDDPAGLIASEILRSAKVAITAAIDNSNRADSIISVAEGALQEISALLLEVESLVDRSSNTGAISTKEVSANQLQLDEIIKSINRIANSTSFGDKKLINGSMGFTTSGLNLIDQATVQGGTERVDIDNLRIRSAKIPEGSFKTVVIERVTSSTFGSISAVGNGTAVGNGRGTISSDVTLEVTGTIGSDVFSFVSGTTAAAIRDTVNLSTGLTGVSAYLSSFANDPLSISAVYFTSTGYGDSSFVSVQRIDTAGKDNFDIDGKKSSRKEGTDGTIIVNGTTATVDGLEISIATNALSFEATLAAAFAGGGIEATKSNLDITGGGALFSISPTLGLANQENVGIDSVTAANLGSGVSTIGFLSSLRTGQSNDMSQQNFAKAQRIVRSAIDQISTLRGRLGAFQRNTLTTNINTLGVAFENIAAAESMIRDADFAVETAALTRSQILVNASTVTLQLANAAPQNVLALLG